MSLRRLIDMTYNSDFFYDFNSFTTVHLIPISRQSSFNVLWRCAICYHYFQDPLQLQHRLRQAHLSLPSVSSLQLPQPPVCPLKPAPLIIILSRSHGLLFPYPWHPSWISVTTSRKILSQNPCLLILCLIHCLLLLQVPPQRCNYLSSMLLSSTTGKTPVWWTTQQIFPIWRPASQSLFRFVG